MTNEYLKRVYADEMCIRDRVLGVVSLILSLCAKGDSEKKVHTVASVVVTVAAVLLRLMCSENALTKFFAHDQLFKACLLYTSSSQSF